MTKSSKMNIWSVMSGMGMLSGLREKLIRAGISPQDLQGVDFSNKESLNKLAEKIVPKLLRDNPQIAKQIKESGWLEGETKEKVTEVIDAI